MTVLGSDPCRDPMGPFRITRAIPGVPPWDPRWGPGKSLGCPWEVLGGARYTKQDLDVSIKNGPDLINPDEDWWVGFFGGRFSAQLSKNWTFVGRGDFGVGAGKTNRIWNFVGMFDYRFKDWGSVFAGYKYMNYDYENSDMGKDHYAYDASQQGPLLGLNIRW